MILSVLICNRDISFAFFKKSEKAPAPLATFCVAAQPARTADEYAALLEAFLKRAACEAPQSVILASVVPPLTDEVRRAIQLVCGDIPVLTVGAGLRSGLSLRTDMPAELGADLVAMAVGATTVQKPPFLVLHCGDVTTISAVADGKDAPVYLGCAILPGATLCVKTLKQEAALLSTVALTHPTHAIGKNTNDSVRAGLLLGHAAAIERLISDFEREMGAQQLPVIVTGEEAELLLPLLRHPAQKIEALAHKGLCKIASLNERKTGNAPKRGE